MPVRVRRRWAWALPAAARPARRGGYTVYEGSRPTRQLPLAFATSKRAGTATGPPSGFLLLTDPRRVSYSGVVWRHAGLDWRIEGRASAAELFSLAEEVRSGTRVPGA